MDTSNKMTWVQLGETMENEFLRRRFEGVLFSINPSREKRPWRQGLKWEHDFIVQTGKLVRPCDLKSVRTPFRNAMDWFEMTPAELVTINEKDIVRYKRLYPKIVIAFDVNHEFNKGTWIVSLSRLEKAIADNDAKLHQYRTRSYDDSGNGVRSYILSLDWMTKLYEITEEAIH